MGGRPGKVGGYHLQDSGNRWAIGAGEGWVVDTDGRQEEWPYLALRRATLGIENSHTGHGKGPHWAWGRATLGMDYGRTGPGEGPN